jgi:hypothetical protein
MKKLLTQFLGLTLGCLLVNTGFAQLAATESSDANELIELFLNDNGNLSYSNASLIGAEGAAGTYTGADFDETEGVILSTGAVVEAAGPNNSNATTTNFSADGDSDLEDLADKSTNDAISLSADFVAEGSTISFSYAFASEDYNAYICSPFSDVMAVFVNGGAYANQNIALVPSTELLVTSNTINSGSIEDNIWQEEGCPEGGLDNNSLYVDNDGVLNYEYNGRSTFLDSEIAVNPGETYTIRWVIADGTDALFDSALLLEAGSLNSSGSECTVQGGLLTLEGPTTVCKSDGIDDSFALQTEGSEGENQVFVTTLVNGQILLITDNYEVNLEGIPGNGTCLFWSLSWDGEIVGAEVGLNANDLMGDCFELSNPIPVAEYFTDGGEISTIDETTICVGDGIPDLIDVTLVADQGQNMAWVITDADLNILDLPAGPSFDLEGAGEGLCIIWHLSWSGDIEGAMVGANAGDLAGDCFDLSNPIEVERNPCDQLLNSVTWKYDLTMAPNPTEGGARVSFSSSQDSQTTISVYNLNGQRVEVLLDQNTEAGVKYMLPFDGNNLPVGIYMYQISNGKEVKMQKLVIAR